GSAEGGERADQQIAGGEDPAFEVRGAVGGCGSCRIRRVLGGGIFLCGGVVHGPRTLASTPSRCTSSACATSFCSNPREVRPITGATRSARTRQLVPVSSRESWMAKDHKRLGDLLLSEQLISAEQLTAAVAEQRRSGQLLGATLVNMGFITEQDLLDRLQQQLGLKLVDLTQVVIDEAALTHITEDLAKKYAALPVEVEGRSTLIVAMADPLNVAALEDLRFHSGMFIKPVLAAPAQIHEAITRHYHIDTSMNEVIQNIITNENDLVVSTVELEEQTEALDDLMKEAEGRPIVRLTNWLMHQAVEDRASDIHIEPQQRDLI